MMDEVLEFNARRFKFDSDWVSGNCYYFSIILKDRFPDGVIFYDVVKGHFVFELSGKYYDWTGEIIPAGYLVQWDEFEKYDSLQKQRIIQDCLK